MIRILLLVAGVAKRSERSRHAARADTWFFRLIPGVPDTGPFNAHLVADLGTFYVPIGVGLLVAAHNPARHVAVGVAAGASLLHALLHLVSPTAALAAIALAVTSGAATARD
jgi:hypothetical protein